MPGLFHSNQEIILASASPRRKDFLHELGLEFTVVPAVIDETPKAEEPEDEFVRRMAGGKAGAVARRFPESAVIGADTVLSFQGKILGKPKDHDHALEVLNNLQGQQHQVITGYCLCCGAMNLCEVGTRTSTVTFGRFPEEILKAYVNTGEPMDKAGGYAIQGMGGFLVRSIEGSCSNVIGLPMNDLVMLLLKHKVISACQPGQ